MAEAKTTWFQTTMGLHFNHAKSKKVYPLIRLAAVLLLCNLSALTSLHAQDSDVEDSMAESINLVSTLFPSDLDSVKVDSFFKTRSIALNQACNLELYTEVFRWYNTCYRWGGNSKSGIDCSHFVNMLCEKIYHIAVGPSAGDIYAKCKILKGGMAKAREGDLLFFRLKGKGISHVGIYLQNGMFAHASTKLGVCISSIEEPYYKRGFYKLGRIKKAG